MLDNKVNNTKQCSLFSLYFFTACSLNRVWQSMLNCAENTSSSLRMTSYLISGVWGSIRHKQREDRALKAWDLWVDPGGLSK